MSLTHDEIRRLEGEDLDAEVAREVMRRTPEPRWEPSSNPAQLFMLADAMTLRGCGLLLEDCRGRAEADVPWAACFVLPDGRAAGHMPGVTPGEAACRAALLALRCL